LLVFVCCPFSNLSDFHSGLWFGFECRVWVWDRVCAHLPLPLNVNLSCTSWIFQILL
jgi:hypothetical protein